MDAPGAGRWLACGLLILLLVAACGCARVGLDDGTTTPALTKTTPVQQTSALSTPGVQSPQTLRTLPSAPQKPTTVPVTTIIPPTRSADNTCAGKGGFILEPGTTCTGQFVDASDTFSCCSVLPAIVLQEKPAVTAVPLDLRLNLADDPGAILP